MKPAPFDYLRAASVAEAVATPAEFGDGSKVLAAVDAALGLALGVVELPVRPEAALRLAEGVGGEPTSEPGGA